MSNRLIHGDCLEEMAKLEPGSVSMILVDPPYGVTACDWDSVLDFSRMWQCIHRTRREDSPSLIFGNEPFSSYLRLSNIKEYKYDWVWIKNQATNHLHADKMPMRKTENISAFFENHSWYNPQKTKGHIPTRSAKGSSDGRVYYGNNTRNYSGGDTDRMPLNIQAFDCTSNYDKKHPNEKPVPLLEYLIRSHSNENDVILDFCMGSGSTGVACIKTNRRFIGIEKEKEYFDVAQDRIKRAEKKFQNSFGIVPK